ncbi:TonB-dependent receptor [Parashewanella spongiae]|uniref:TonB-dependent receptor n=1 Tax=Parashewanella spongiae TaxID=342950 RepID=A0A3A6UBK0_9GAMM|nr:TonB-dependent receptor [Parashewanella spongiae]MCL1078695.1 TonB-dependent receptor [Parashewanella spongiae]RJY19396.1 TonB-dependent receptor [Parashewanella spongiae]
MINFKPSVLTIALATAGLSYFFCTPLAQAADENETGSGTVVNTEKNSRQPSSDVKEEKIERIQITGFRRSLIDSLNAKRFADTVSEQLSADDLGSLPDVSMADALTRLPGISAVRTSGQAAEINIRGMSGGFVASTLNGREQVSTNGERSIQFDQYPSELINSAAVYKSSKASLIEGGIAGTVELETISPLDADDAKKFKVNLRGMHNDRAGEVYGSQDYGHRFTVSYLDKYLDETVGVAVGYARLQQPSVATQFIGFAVNDSTDVDHLADDTNGPESNPANEYISEGFELQHVGGVETRNAYMATIEWAPVESFNFKADAFVSRFDKDAFARGMRVKFGGPNAAWNNANLDGNVVTGGNVNRTSNSYTRVEIVNDNNRDTDEVNSFGVNAAWQVTDDLAVDFDVSYSGSKSNFRNGLLWSNVAVDANAETPIFDENVSINYQLNGLDLPDVGFNQADAFSDINRVVVSKYGIYPFLNDDSITAYRLDFDYSLDSEIFSSVQFGVRYSDRHYSKDRAVFEYGNDGAFSKKEPPLRLTEDMVDVVDWEGDFSYFPSYLAIDVNQALNAWFPAGIPQPVQTWGNAGGVIDPKGYTTNYSWTVLQSGDVFEKVLSAYAMVNIDAEIASIPVSGNIGIRAVDTDQKATILEFVGDNPELGAQYIVDEQGIVNNQYAPTLKGIEYTDYLPSLNLSFNIDEDGQYIRFAAAKVMSRSPISRLAGDISAQADNDGRITGSSNNNPFLKPFYANQYDLSFESYSENTSYVAALFYKDIKSFIQTVPIPEFDFKGNGFNVPDFIIDPLSGEQIETVNGTYTTAVNNAEGGYIRGIELAYSHVFDWLPDAWSGLGFNLSYSYTESEVSRLTNLGGESVKQSLPGLSKQVASATFFYGYEGFETRMNVRYRDEFVSEQVALDNQVVNFDDELVLDYQASYAFNDDFSVLFQVNNFTDEPTKSYFGKQANTGTIQYFGREFYMGFNYAL